MKIFITGINGFIGSRLALSLLTQNHQVSGSVRSTSDLSLLKGIDVKLFRGSLDDSEFVSQAISGNEIIFHVAGFASDWGDFEKFYDANVVTTQTLARAAVKANVKKFIFISSTAIYGFSGFRYADENMRIPLWNFPYARTKWLAERWLISFARNSKLPFTIIEPANVFGPADRTFLFPFLKALKQGVIPFIDWGKAWTCPVFVENLTDAMIKAAISDRSTGERFIISDGLDIDWRFFIRKICQAFELEEPRFSVPFELAMMLAKVMEFIYKILRKTHSPPVTEYRILNFGRDYHFSIEKAKHLLRFIPKTSFDEALEIIREWSKNWKGKEDLFKI